MNYKYDFALNENICAKNKHQSTYMENYQKYIDEYCTPPHYKKQQPKPQSQQKSFSEMNFDEMLKALM